MNLLTIDNDAKTVKGNNYGYRTAVMYLAPSREADGIHTMCARSTPECERACLWTAGRASFTPSIIDARIARTMFFITDRKGFYEQLEREANAFINSTLKTGLKPVFRYNGTSDRPDIARRMACMFPHVGHYDYTKIERPWERRLANYHLTFSYSGSNLEACHEALKHDINVAVVFKTPDLPDKWDGIPVINGDRHDLRFLDPKPVIVGLKAKGQAKLLTVGSFVQAV